MKCIKPYLNKCIKPYLDKRIEPYLDKRIEPYLDKRIEPYLNTTTSEQVEYTKAFEITIIKELGKFTHVTSGEGGPFFLGFFETKIPEEKEA